MHLKSHLALLTAATLGAGFALMAVTPAQAAEKEPLTLQVVRHKGSALKKAEKFTGDQRRRMNDVESEFIARRAQLGRLLDTRQVETFTSPGAQVIAVADTSLVIDSINIGTYKDTDGTVAGQGFGAEIHEESGSAPSTPTTPTIGFAGNPSTTGYQLVSNKTLELKPKVGDWTQKVITDYWKYKLPENLESAAFAPAYRTNSDFWAYARRGLGDSADKPRLVDLTVRSRPWGGTSSRFRNVIDKAPTGTTTACTSTGTIGFTYAGHGVQIPYNNCYAVKGVTSTSSALEFGADWDGNTTDPQTVEAIASVRVVAGQTPSWADYIWASFTNNPAGGYYDYKWADSGW
jgi:hypothetical protein